MFSRSIVASILMVGTLAAAPFAMQGDKARSQSAIVSFSRPTWVAGELLIGTYVIVHDENRMMRGEPCTALYRVGAQNRPVEDPVVSFRCIPRDRRAVPGFTTTVITNPAGGIDAADVLVEYQFGNDPEVHGVPIGAALADNPPRAPEADVCLR